MTQATTTSELPGHKPGRAAKIAAIHALADWYTDHPDVEMPTDINASVVHHRPTLAEYGEPRLDEPARVDRVLQFAAVHGGRPFEGDTSVQTSLVVLARKIHGLHIVHSVVAIKDRDGERRYVP